MAFGYIDLKNRQVEMNNKTSFHRIQCLFEVVGVNSLSVALLQVVNSGETLIPSRLGLPLADPPDAISRAQFYGFLRLTYAEKAAEKKRTKGLTKSPQWHSR